MFTIPFLISSLFVFALGVSVGSFLTVVIYRGLHGESPFEGRSKCDYCGKPIAWYDNIPIFSYLILRGKSRCCQKEIPILYPIVEFMTAALFVWWFWFGSFFFHLTQQPFVYIQPLFWLLVGILLLIIFVTDYISYIIPDYAVGLLLILAFVYRASLTLFGIMNVQDFYLSVIGMVATAGFFFFLWFFTQGKGMGFGDVKFALPMGLLVGWPNILIAVFLSFIYGSIVAMYLLLSRKKKIKQTIPFGPFLVLGTISALLFGEQLLQWYLSLL